MDKVTPELARTSRHSRMSVQQSHVQEHCQRKGLASRERWERCGGCVCKGEGVRRCAEENEAGQRSGKEGSKAKRKGMSI